MRRLIKPAIIVTAGITAIAAVFLVEFPESSSGQQYPITGREPPCKCFCGGGSADTFNIADKNCSGTYGTVSSDACDKYFKDLPPSTLTTVCQDINRLNKNSTSCPLVRKYCQEKKLPPEDRSQSCDPPAAGSENTPWNPAGCKDYQDVSFRMTGASIVATGCGQVLSKQIGDKI